MASAIPLNPQALTLVGLLTAANHPAAPVTNEDKRPLPVTAPMSCTTAAKAGYGVWRTVVDACSNFQD